MKPRHRSNSAEIEEMLTLWKTGKYTYAELGRICGKDHTTILHHVQKAGLWVQKIRPRPVRIQLPKIPSPRTIRPRIKEKYDTILYEDKINPGKSYNQYLNEAKRRKGPEGKAYRDRGRGLVFTRLTLPKDKKGGKRGPWGAELAPEDL